MRRLREFDAIRGITAMVIVLAHLGRVAGSPWVLTTVDLFFVLSGYFITRNILAAARSPHFFRIFYARRALRIWPAYYVALAGCLILGPWIRGNAPPEAWPYYLTFTQNIQAYWGGASPRFSAMFLHTWTLAIEEQFYLVWPILVVRAGRRGLVPLAGAFVLVPPALRALGLSPYLLLTRCDGLGWGSILATAFADGARPRRRAAALLVVGLLALSAPAWWGVVLDPLRRAWPAAPWPRLLASATTARCCLAYYALAGLVLCFEGHPRLAILRDPRLCYVGRISYGLYLYHPFVFAILPTLYKRHVARRLGLNSPLLTDVVLIATCFVLAELSRRLVEDPIQAWKARLTYRRGSPVTARDLRIDVASPPAGPHPEPVGAVTQSLSGRGLSDRTAIRDAIRTF